MDSIVNAASAAVGLADNFGWSVFPVNPSTKAPLIAGWQDYASCSWASVEELFKSHPTAAIGVVTGKKSNLIVIDLDERERFSGIANFRKAGYELTETIRTKTPSGGICSIRPLKSKFQIPSPKLRRALMFEVMVGT